MINLGFSYHGADLKESLGRCGITLVKSFRAPSSGEHEGEQRRGGGEGEPGVHSL